ncbi:MAG: hypothetical protein GXY36_00545 [Chloroflexi bacterium]|nr:hypothetical protein [Chloroflexota bacterium]
MKITFFRLTILLIAAALLLGLGLPAAAGQGVAPQISPRQMLNIYYGWINSRRYDLAYNQWVAPPHSYDAFVAGYADTTRADAFFGGFQPALSGALQGAVPGVLIGYHTDGSAQAYAGCYFLTYNSSGTGTDVWRISLGWFRRLDALPAPGTIQVHLSADCYPRLSVIGTPDTAQEFLIEYYNAINRQDYAAAYGLWLNPPHSYQNFVAGYADTTDVVLFHGDYQINPALTTPESGRVPVVLFGYHTDGSMVPYSGCYSLSFNPNLPVNWRIVGGDLQPMVMFGGTPDAAAIQQALAVPCYGAGFIQPVG